MRPSLVIATLLALAAGASAQKYTSREEYAKQNEFELAPVLVASGVPAACKAGAATYMKDTDLFGADITPTILVKSEGDESPNNPEGESLLSCYYPDTVYDASSPESCCTLCHIHPDCAAFTWTDASNCDEWLGSSTVGCCFLKYGSGFTINAGEAAKGMVSGILPQADVAAAAAAKATCTILPDTDTAGADLTFDSILPDLVVPAGSAQACCNACARVEGCAAFTLTPSDYCESRLGKNNPGCCFLKPANGWDGKKDNTTTFLTSGRLLGSSNKAAAAGGASGGSGARRLTRRIMGLLQ